MFSLRDLDIASGQLAPAGSETAPDAARIEAAFTEMPIESLQALQHSVATATAALKAIDAAMATQAGVEATPALDGLSAQLVKMEKVVRTRLAARGEATGAEAGADGGTATGAGVMAIGAITSRQDAIRALDAVAEFFRRTEPSSPIPMFVERAKRLVSKNFLEVLADVAPDAVGQAMMAGGVTPTPE
jgi:type VI secretion system protein ImpA